MALKDLYEKMVGHEWARLEQLYSRVTSQAGLSVIVVTPLVYFAKHLALVPCSCASVLFAIFLAAASISWIVQGAYLFRAWHGYIYRHVPGANDLQENYDGLRAHHRAGDNQDDERAELANRKFQDRLTDYYRIIADHNWRQNNRRSGYLHTSRGWLGICLVLLLPSFGMHILIGNNQELAVNPNSLIEVIMSEQPIQPEDPTPAPTDVTPEDLPATDLTPPEPPPLDPPLIREGDAGPMKTQ